MRAMQIVEFGEPLELREYPTPEPSGEEVLVRVTACGVCHSDLHLWSGAFDLGGGEVLRLADRGMKLPFTMGHEPLGTVESLGPEVDGAEVGESYVVHPWIGCGDCAVCRRGDELLCLAPRVIGTRVDGGFADYVSVPNDKYLIDYAGVPQNLACTYACSGLTAYSALRKVGELGPDDFVMTIGAGAAATIDFVGRPETSRFGIDCLQKGGRQVQVGLYGEKAQIPLPFFPLKMISMIGSYVGSLEEMHELMELVKAGKVPPLPVEARPLEAVNSALDDLTAGHVLGRVVVKP